MLSALQVKALHSLSNSIDLSGSTNTDMTLILCAVCFVLCHVQALASDNVTMQVKMHIDNLKKNKSTVP